MTPEDAICFQAQLVKVQTMADGGWRLTLDLGEVSPETLIALSNAKKPGVLLECACLAIEIKKSIGDW